MSSTQITIVLIVGVLLLLMLAYGALLGLQPPSVEPAEAQQVEITDFL